MSTALFPRPRRVLPPPIPEIHPERTELLARLEWYGRRVRAGITGPTYEVTEVERIRRRLINGTTKPEEMPPEMWAELLTPLVPVVPVPSNQLNRFAPPDPTPPKETPVIPFEKPRRRRRLGGQ